MAENLIRVSDFDDADLRDTLTTAGALARWLARDASRPNDAPFAQVLRGVMVHLAFFEPSTRTRVSFETAAKLLGATTISFTAADSSLVKGESLEDTAQTLYAMCPHVVVMRHPEAGSAARLAHYLPVPVVNGGDGRGHHPTQALLDAVTVHAERALWNDAVKTHFEPVESPLHLAIVGDIANSRVARSNAELWTRLGHRVTLVGPRPLLPNAPPFAGVEITSDLDAIIGDIDFVMMLRMQKERMGDSAAGTPQASTAIAKPSSAYGIESLVTQYALNSMRLACLRPDALILHPGPCNRGVEIDDAAYRDPRCRIRDQVRYGVAVRMYVLALLAGRIGRLYDAMDSLGLDAVNG
jgi:aspartate carbamoyltransferase catalytic subunit